MTTATSIYCPSCGRYIAEAEEIKAQRLRCKGCKESLLLNLQSGILTVHAAKFCLVPPKEVKA